MSENIFSSIVLAVNRWTQKGEECKHCLIYRSYIRIDLKASVTYIKLIFKINVRIDSHYRQKKKRREEQIFIQI